MLRTVVVMLAFGMCAAPALAQPTGNNPPTTESAAAAQTPPRNGESKWKAGADWIKSAIRSEKPHDGLYAELHGLPPGSGIHVGPGFRHTLFGSPLVVDASAALAWSRGTFAQATLELPHLANDRLNVGAQVTRQDFTRVSFFGIGPSSLETNGSDYRLKNIDYTAFLAVRPRTWLTMAGSVAYSPAVEIERPRVATFPAAQDLFLEATAPALTASPAFLHSESYVDVDTRNHSSRPTSGGNYRVALSTFSDRDLRRYSFRRIEAEASRFIPILHDNYVIALRARVAGTDTTKDNTVPFYLLPTLGGSRSLRGYRDYRFRDRNLLLLNAEYRWAVFSALDAALFYDAGTVAPRFGDLHFKNLRTSYGVGFRFHSNETTFFRLDAARSNEGTRVLVSIGEVLRPGHGSISIPYVP